MSGIHYWIQHFPNIWVLIQWINFFCSVAIAAPLVSMVNHHSNSSLETNNAVLKTEQNLDYHFVNGLKFNILHTKLLINEPRLCEESQFAIFFVHSAVQNIKQRNAIRESWGSVADDTNLDVKVIFIVGIPPSDEVEPLIDIHREQTMHHDIIQSNIVDVYANLTIKSVIMLDWITKYCPNTKYIIKSDDDTFLNSRLLIKDLRGYVHNKFMMGDIIAAAQPIRDKNSKYFTSNLEYSDKTYPTYLSGATYVISGDLIEPLSKASKETELFWLEDVFITGFLARQVHAKHIFNGKFGFRTESLAPCQFRKRIAFHRINPKEMQNAWTLLQKEEQNC